MFPKPVLSQLKMQKAGMLQILLFVSWYEFDQVHQEQHSLPAQNCPCEQDKRSLLPKTEMEYT